MQRSSLGAAKKQIRELSVKRALWLTRREIFGAERVRSPLCFTLHVLMLDLAKSFGQIKYKTQVYEKAVFMIYLNADAWANWHSGSRAGLYAPPCSTILSSLSPQNPDQPFEVILAHASNQVLDRLDVGQAERGTF
jgi:hypothetical protein